MFVRFSVSATTSAFSVLVKRTSAALVSSAELNDCLDDMRRRIAAFEADISPKLAARKWRRELIDEDQQKFYRSKGARREWKHRDGQPRRQRKRHNAKHQRRRADRRIRL